MKKLLLFCFFIANGLMASGGFRTVIADVEEVLKAAWQKINIDHTSFEMADGLTRLKEGIPQAIVTNCFNDEIGQFDADRVQEIVADLTRAAGGFGFIEGKKEVLAYKEALKECQEYYAKFYNTNPKKIALGIATFIIAGSVIYTGKKVVDKFMKWRNNDNE